MYQGDGGEIQHEIGVNTTLTINTPGSQVFPQVLAAAKSLLDGLSASDADAIRLSLEQIDTAQDEVLAKLADGGARPKPARRRRWALARPEH